ncbi:hypothetical protein [Algibacillus agarilyticus]|uniref:hypothetical protein n=1 Tax=Algibacillus agarilyticus TaxID=2234133 RepID=UPI000DD01F2D|nr:hypothetical protein [Algibacillus agarilyticus]
MWLHTLFQPKRHQTTTIQTRLIPLKNTVHKKIKRITPRRKLAGIGLLVALISGCMYIPHQANVDLTQKQIDQVKRQAKPAVDAILDKFSTHTLVAMGDYHWNAEVMQFINNLVAQPRFAHEIKHIIVEFGNARFQPLLNDYLQGKAVSDTELKQVMRSSIFFTAWQPNEYGQFFSIIRQHNLHLSTAEQIKVTLAEPAFTWQASTTQTEWQKAANNKVSGFYAQAEKAIQKKQKTLMVFGAFHLLKATSISSSPIPIKNQPLATQIEAQYPGKLYVVWPATQPEFTQAIADITNPALIELNNSPIGDLAFVDLLPKSKVRLSRMERLDAKASELSDAYLFVGQTERSTRFPPDVMADKAWIKEMQRRVAIVGGRVESAFESILEQSAQ